MNKNLIASFVIGFSVLTPLSSFAQSGGFFELADLKAARAAVESACGVYAAQSDWPTCMREHAGITDSSALPSRQRVTIRDKALSFSVSLPLFIGAKANDKDVRAYTIDSERGSYLFGKVDSYCATIQEGVCEIDRQYMITVRKGSLNAAIAAYHADLAGENVSSENLPVLEFSSNGNRIALIPHMITNSGHTSVHYSKLFVEKRGAVIELAPTQIGYDTGLDAELWRVASSIR